MPNWTTNYIKFDDEETAERIWEALKVPYKKAIHDNDYNIIGYEDDKRFSYESIIPRPATKEECPTKYIVANAADAHITEDEEKPWLNWYSWQCDNWGVKWDASDACLDGDEIQWSSPWDSPCDEFFQGIADKFNVSFERWADDEDGGWRGICYNYSPGEPMFETECQWQLEENDEREEEYRREMEETEEAPDDGEDERSEEDEDE